MKRLNETRRLNQAVSSQDIGYIKEHIRQQPERLQELPGSLSWSKMTKDTYVQQTQKDPQNSRIVRFGRWLTQLTPEALYQKIYNVPRFVQFLVVLTLVGTVTTGIYAVGLRNSPIGIHHAHEELHDNTHNFTVNQTFKIGDQSFSIVTYTKDGQWRASIWDESNREFKQDSLIENDILLSHPIAIGQVIALLNEEVGAIQEFEVVDEETLKINGNTIKGVLYNTQLTKISVGDDVKRVSTFYNTLLRQRGQVDLLDKYDINIPDIALRRVDSDGTVEFIYQGAIYRFVTEDDEGQVVRLLWVSQGGGVIG